jgi:hypothetical protein
MSDRRRFLAAGVAMALCAATSLKAHRLRMAMTTVRWRPDRGLLEITHRLHTGDAELALAGGTPGSGHDDEGHHHGRGALSMDNARQRARIALYVARRFGLIHPDSGPMALNTLGAEVEGDNVFVYQEGALPALPARLQVRNEILTEVFTDQTNHVNVHAGGEVFSLVFRAGSTPREPQWLRLDGS